MASARSENRLDKGVLILAGLAALLWLVCIYLSLGSLDGVARRVVLPDAGQESLGAGKIWRLQLGLHSEASFPAQLRVSGALEKEAVHLVLRSGSRQVAPSSRSGRYVYFTVESLPPSGLELLNLGSQPLKLDEARLRNYLAINLHPPRMAVLLGSSAANTPELRLWVLTLAGLILFVGMGLLFWRRWSGAVSVLPLVALMGPPIILFGAVVVLKALAMHLELGWESFWLAALLTPLLLLLPRVFSWFAVREERLPALACFVCLLVFGAMIAGGYISEKGRSLPGGPSQMIHLGERYLKDPAYVPQGTKLEEIGYDGQFFFYMAQDPLARNGAWRNLDSPAYRYQRILYPAILYLFTGGDKESLPAAMNLINAAALLGLLAVLCLWCRGLGISRFWGLLVLCNYGVIYPAFAGLSEPVANLLLMSAMYLIWRQRAGCAALCMALMVLCKEYYVILPVGALAWAWIKKEKGRLVYAIPIVVVALWQLVIHWRFGMFAFEQSSGNFDWPLVWLAHHLVETPYASHIAFCLASLVLLAITVWRWFKGGICRELVLLSLFLILPLAAGPSIWASENGFMRVFSPAYLAYVAVVMQRPGWVVVLPALAFAVHAGLQMAHL